MTVESDCAAVAHSEHPIATRAVGECAGELLDAGFPAPDILLVVADRSFSGTMKEVAEAFDALLSPSTSVAFVSDRIVASGRALRSGSAMAAMALSGWEAAPLVVPEGVSPADATKDCLADLPDGFAPGGPTYAFVVLNTACGRAAGGSPMRGAGPQPDEAGSPETDRATADWATADWAAEGWLVAGLAHPALHINGVPADFAGGIILDSEANGRGPLRELIHPKEALSGTLAWRPDACAVVAVLDPVHSGFMDEHSDGAGLLLDPDLRGCSLAFRGRTPGMPEGHSAAHVFGSAM